MKNIFALVIFLSSTIGKFLIIALLIGIFLIPKPFLEIYGFIIGIIFIILFIASIVALFKWTFNKYYR